MTLSTGLGCHGAGIWRLLRTKFRITAQFLPKFRHNISRLRPVMRMVKLTIDRTRWDIRYRSGKFFDNLANSAISDDIEFDMQIVARKNKLALTPPVNCQSFCSDRSCRVTVKVIDWVITVSVIARVNNPNTKHEDHQNRNRYKESGFKPQRFLCNCGDQGAIERAPSGIDRPAARRLAHLYTVSI